MTVVTSKDRRRQRTQGTAPPPTEAGPTRVTKKMARRQKAQGQPPQVPEPQPAVEVPDPEAQQPPPPPPPPPDPPAPAPTPEEDQHTQIVEAIRSLDVENPEHFTSKGDPRIAALEAITGLEDISAGERDKAMEEIDNG